MSQYLRCEVGRKMRSSTFAWKGKSVIHEAYGISVLPVTVSIRSWISSVSR